MKREIGIFLFWAVLLFCGTSLITRIILHVDAQEPLTFYCTAGTITTLPQSNGAVRITCKPFAAPTPTPTPTPTPKPSASPLVQVIKPEQFSSVIAAGGVLPGCTVELRGGVYRGNFTASVSGTATAPIVFRAYPGERPILDGANQAQAALTINGAHTTWRDIEFTMSGANRSAVMAPGVNVFGAGTKIINCVIHDCGGGVGAWVPAVDAEIYGCLIFNNGYRLPDRAHGHGIYGQGEQGTKRLIDNVLFGNFYAGLHWYTEGGALKGLYAEGNAFFSNGAVNVLIGGLKPAERITLKENIAYQPLTFGATNVQLASVAPSLDLTLDGNYIAGATEPLWLAKWATVNATRNIFVGAHGVGRTDQRAGSVWTFSGNEYVAVGGALPYALPVAMRSVANAAALGVKTFLRRNQYEDGRAHLIIFNWPRQATVAVDLSSVLKVGERFEAVNVANLAAPVLSGVFNGAAVQVPTPAEFQAFILRRTQ